MMNETKLTKNDRREHARQIAREAREKAKKSRENEKDCVMGHNHTHNSNHRSNHSSIHRLIKSPAPSKASSTSPGNMGTDGIILSTPTTAIPNGEYNLEDGAPTDSVEQNQTELPRERKQTSHYSCT
jgi:hypothetical protein